MNNKLYTQELIKEIKKIKDIDKLANTTILIAGATGMIGSCIVDIIMHLNIEAHLNCRVIALGRNEIRAQKRFKDYWNNKNFFFKKNDINRKVEVNEKINYIIHAASNTHPIAYSKYPVETINTNVIGTNNLLKLAVSHNVQRFIFLSSVEIYGENRGDTEKFDESYLGYLNCNTLRAGYPEGKRVGESLCQAYHAQYGLDIVIPRLARSFGPTMLMSDSKAMSQFIKNGIRNKNIVLKSSGEQEYSYIYSIDAAGAILFCLLNGKNSEAYNVAGNNCIVKLKNAANMIANICNTKVIFKLPDMIEATGYSKATKAILDVSKLAKLGYSSNIDLNTALKMTIDILLNEKDESKKRI